MVEPYHELGRSCLSFVLPSNLPPPRPGRGQEVVEFVVEFMVELAQGAVSSNVVAESSSVLLVVSAPQPPFILQPLTLVF